MFIMENIGKLIQDLNSILWQLIKKLIDLHID
jgi:hypothetical protein